MSENLRVKTNIGFVPSDWNKIKIENIVTEISRFSKDDNIPLYSLTINEGLICKPQKYEREFLVKDEDDNYKIIKKDEFALNPMNLRFGAIAKMKNGNCARVSKYYNIFKFNELVDSNFLEAFLKSERVLNYYNRMATGTLEEKKRVHFSQFIKFEFYLPPLIEQQKIAEILSTWDLAIEKQEQLIEKKKEFKKGLMQRLLSGEVRFKEFKDEWTEVLLGDVLYEPKKEKVKEPNKYELITVRLHCNGIERTGKYPSLTEKGRPYYFREPGELLIGRQNFHNGGIGIVPNNFKNKICSNAITSLLCKDNIDIKFIYYYLSRPEFYKRIELLIGGTGQKEISKSEFNRLKIKLPNYFEQKKIANTILVVDREIELLVKELESIKLQKKGLMQRLLTGEVRVKI